MATLIWISVRDRLPNDRRRVLVACQSSFLGIGVRNAISISRLGRGVEWEIERRGIGPLVYVTHWAELPPNPLGDE